jgi:hypothetical protein
MGLGVGDSVAVGTAVSAGRAVDIGVAEEIGAAGDVSSSSGVEPGLADVLAGLTVADGVSDSPGVAVDTSGIPAMAGEAPGVREAAAGASGLAPVGSGDWSAPGEEVDVNASGIAAVSLACWVGCGVSLATGPATTPPGGLLAREDWANRFTSAEAARACSKSRREGSGA